MMNKARPPILGLLLLAGLAACGHKGALLPPLAKLPSPPSDLHLFQKGGTLILEWKNPTTFIDGHALESAGPSAVDVWLVEETLVADKPVPKPPTADEFAAKAQLAAQVSRAQFPEAGKEQPAPKDKTAASQDQAGKTAGGTTVQKKKRVETPAVRYEYALKAGQMTLKRLVFGLRAELNKRKISDFSALAAIIPQALASPPSGLQAAAGNESIELRWEVPADNIDGTKPASLKGYNVYRSEDGAPSVRLNTALTQEPRFSDKTFVFGADYIYTVRAASAEVEPFWESADSAPAAVRPKDVFAPPAPTGLTVLAGPDFMSLSWDTSPEKNLAGYRVWRRVVGQADFQELTTMALKETIFQDKSVEKGTRYEYAVTAEDTAGNKSSLSASVSGQLKGARS